MQECYDMYCYNAGNKVLGIDPYEIKPGELIVSIHDLVSYEDVQKWKKCWSNNSNGLKDRRVVIKKNEIIIEDRVY